HGPFLADAVGRRFGVPAERALAALRALEGDGRVVRSEFRPDGVEREWCDVDVLRQLRRRSLAALRREVEPVDQAAFARFLPAWQHVTAEGRSALHGVDGVAAVVEQLAGVPVPASAWESLVLPSRVRDYRPGML